MAEAAKRVACVGAGLVGSAWAALFAKAGFDVSIFDKDQQALRDHALPAIRATLDLLGAEPRSAERVRIAPSLAAAVTDAELVQESVREDIAIKRAVAADIAEHAPLNCLIASSTSALPGSGFLTDIPAPDRALVAHPVNPPSLIRLVELCGTPKTSAETMGRARAVYETIGMVPVELNREIDGFLLNRLQYTLVAEAMHLVGEGYCTPEDIDKVLTEGLAPRWAFIGPFMTAHLNSSQGFQGFVDQLGPMMRRMGEDARTDYRWTDDDVANIHERISRQVPVSDIREAQERRNANILRLRKLREPDATGRD